MSSIRILGSEAVNTILDSLSVNNHVDLMRRVFAALVLKDSEVVNCPPRASGMTLYTYLCSAAVMTVFS